MAPLGRTGACPWRSDLISATLRRASAGRWDDVFLCWLGQVDGSSIRGLRMLSPASSMHMVALYTVWYNYVKQHKTLKGISPAMAAGISDTLWSLTDLAEMVDAAQPKAGKRSPYKKIIAENSN
jgi:hypothetical protein